MKELGIYVHIPFCLKKCAYCDFISFPNKLDLQEKYIFVHSWIPISEEKFGIKSFIEDWRNATEEQWKDVRWGNPFELAEGVLKPDKTVVFGHWHTTWPRACWEGKAEFGAGADFSTYYGKGYIGLDAMTAHSGKVNVLVVDDEFLK